MNSLENYRKMLNDSSLYKLEFKKSKILDKLNSCNVYENTKNIDN